MALRPWLYRISLNISRNQIRSMREIGGLDDRIVPDNDSLGESREAAMDALAALGGLTERQRAAVALRYLEDLSYAEISAATGWPEGTAKTLAHRGVRKMRELMDVEEA